MNPHVSTGIKFRSKIVIDGLQPDQGWWFLSCDDCNWRAVEEGPMYRWTNERYRLPLVASGNGSSVDMVSFSDTARDLIGKDADVLLAESYALVSTVPSEISALTGKCYVVDVTVSRYSFRTMDICFLVLKFYPGGSTIFVDHDAALVAAGKSAAPLPDSAAGVVEKGSASGSANKENHTTIPTRDINAPLSTPPPASAKETPQKELSGQDGEGEHDPVDGALPQSTQQIKKGGNITKRQLFSEGGGKSIKKDCFLVVSLLTL